jgi:EmrB/QacA subfamily drug resistance transporter
MTVTVTRQRMPQVGVLMLVAAAEFLLTVDLSIVNVALPAIHNLGFGAYSLPWVVTGYALPFGGLLLLGGRAADLFGGRRIFCGALLGFTVASLACALAPGPAALITARVVQGMSAGVLAPTTLSILTGTYRESEQRRRALAIWTAVAIGGGAVGGLAGGLLTAALSWRWIFLVNVPIGAVLLGYALHRLPRESGPSTRGPLDLAGAVTATGGLTALVWALARVEVLGWGSPQVLGAGLAAGLLLAAFVLIETRLAPAPLVPRSVFAPRSLAAANLLSFLSFIPVMATWYLLSVHLQGIRGHTPAEAGLWFLPLSLAVIGGAQLGFRLLPGMDARGLFVAGALIGAAGLAWLGQLAAGAPVSWLIVAATVTMAGSGLISAPITDAATSGVAPEHGGLASGLLNTTRQIGGALGLALLGTLAARNAAGDGPQHLAATATGVATAFTAGAVVLLATAAIGALALPGRLAPSDVHDGS